MQITVLQPKTYTLPCGQVLHTKGEFEAYMLGLKAAKAAMENMVDMQIYNMRYEG
jgi:hypothetical protein